MRRRRRQNAVDGVFAAPVIEKVLNECERFGLE